MKRKIFNKVLGYVNNILIFVVLLIVFWVVKKRVLKVFGMIFVVGLFVGVGYFVFMFFRKRFGSMILVFRFRLNYF